ncbi:MAG: glycosyltransferase family 2 protein [Candidatus Aenigmatarchaeota archaeon]
MHVSVIIPTYKRAHLLGYVLDGLRKQTYMDFDVIIILKPSGDGSEEVIEKYRNLLEIDLVFQRHGYVVDALNLGLERASGDVVAFLDDDAIPNVDWLKKHVESYKKYQNVGGVAGNVIPAQLKGGKLLTLNGRSHIIPEFRRPTFLESFFQKVWDAPLKGMENYLVYIDKAGVVEWNSKLSLIAWRKPVRSLLGMGANMSVLFEAINGFRFSGPWVLGLAWEQFLGWHLWRKKYNLIFSPEAIVYHLIHGETLTRAIQSIKKDSLRWVEFFLLFHRLYGLEPNLSRMHRIAWFCISSIVNLKKYLKNREINQINQLKSRFYSELIGLKWLLSRKMHGYYTPMSDLESFIILTKDKGKC